MTHQKTLFPEPEPQPPSGDIDYFGDPLPGDFADYILLELGEYDDPFTNPRETPPDITLIDVPPPEPAPEDLPFGIAAYLQEYYENLRPRIGETLAMRRVYRVANDYHQIEEGEQ